MPTQASQFDLLTAFLDTPVPLQYGLVRGAGKLVLQHELSDKYRIAFYLLGEGPWDSLLRLWINRLSVTLPDTTKVHFHPGDDGEIGAGMAATSTGGDQKVDAFWSSLPGSLSVVGFSRFAYLAVKVPPDPGAPGPELEVLGDYQAMKVRIFSNVGVQTSFAWSQNWVWCAVDKLLRKLVLREARVNQPLTADQVALFDFGLLKTAADYADFDIGGGVKRFSDGGLVWINDGLTADRAAEQLLLMCRSFLGERNGKIFVMERKDEASSFTLTLDDIEAGSFVVEEGIEEGAFNQVIPALRDSALASGSSDNLTRMAEATPEPLNHESHQLATGFAGKGLARIRDAVPLSIDLGVNTAERAWRIGKSLLLETLGDEADPGVTYTGLRRFSVVALEHTVEIVPGDVITVDRGVSEEWSGAKFRVQKAVERADGKRELSGRQHNPNAYPDTAPAQQGLEAPAPGTGLPVVSGAGNYSYRPRSNPLAATDAGATATINVAAFTMEIAQVGQKSVNSGSVSTLTFDTLYYISYKDPNIVGGSVTFEAFATKEDAIQDGRFFAGSIRTPKDGALDTVGNDDGGVGAQFGQAVLLRAGTTAASGTGFVTNAANAIDGDETTYAQVASDDLDGPTLDSETLVLSNYPGSGLAFHSLILDIVSEVTLITAPGSATVEYSTNGGASWTAVYTVTATRSKQKDTVTLAAWSNPGVVQVRMRAISGANGAGGAATGRLHEARMRGVQ